MRKNISNFSVLFILEVIIGRFFSGITPIFIKLTTANTYEIGIARLVITATSFLAIALALKRHIKFTKKNLLICLAIGLSFGLHWLLYFFSIKLSNVTIASIGVASYGVFLLITGNLFFHEKITKREIMALAMALIGSILVIPQYDFHNNLTLGFILGLINAFMFTITGSIHKHMASKINFETRIFSQYSFALLVFIPFIGDTSWNLQGIDWVYLVILAIFCTLITHTLWMREIEKMDLKTAGTVYYLSTIFSIIGGIIILKDPVSWKSLRPMLLFMGGLRQPL